MMKRWVVFLALILFPACDGNATSTSLGCKTDDDCNRAGQPVRWCEKKTGLCMAFTSPLGDLDAEVDAAEQQRDAGL
ncbi:MAG: hypothetical protein J7M25_12615 [Deltaproteobacteria bacterium]|nr:hypothetical protein [Deltaproteobacteria bacterium]